MSRFAIGSSWREYFASIFPSESSWLSHLLEHSTKASIFFRSKDVCEFVFEEKQVGLRGVVMALQDGLAFELRFGNAGPDIDACYTQTGRRFSEGRPLEVRFLKRVGTGISDSGLEAELWAD